MDRYKGKGYDRFRILWDTRSLPFGKGKGSLDALPFSMFTLGDYLMFTWREMIRM